MEIEFKNKHFVPFKDIEEGDTFLYYGRICMKISDITVIEDEGDDEEERTTFNAVYLDVGCAVAFEPEAKFIPIKMKLIEV